MHQYFFTHKLWCSYGKEIFQTQEKWLWINLHLKESLFVQFFSFFFFSTANYMFSKQILWWADVAIIAKCGCGLHGVNSRCGWVCWSDWFCAAKDEKEFSLFLSWLLELLVGFETKTWATQSRQREREREREHFIFNVRSSYFFSKYSTTLLKKYCSFLRICGGVKCSFGGKKHVEGRDKFLMDNLTKDPSGD